MEKRIIKFRAYVTNGEKVSVYEGVGLLNGLVLNKKGEVINKAKLVQFTGLLDRNGKEIYESDLVTTEHGARGVCKWNNESSCFDFDCSEPYWSHPIYGMSGEKEVTGNIYEN